jgi:hypothetical protein
MGGEEVKVKCCTLRYPVTDDCYSVVSIGRRLMADTLWAVLIRGRNRKYCVSETEWVSEAISKT